MGEDSSGACADSESTLVSLHHEKEIVSYVLKTEAWKERLASNVRNIKRCPLCWLRLYECYCKLGSPTLYSDFLFCSVKEKQFKVEVVIYYHYSELGRSPNTAHLLSLICPQLVVETLIFGDVTSESLFIKQLQKEKDLGIERTVVLYPSDEAMFIQDWLHQHAQKSTHRSDKSIDSKAEDEDGVDCIRLVLLDGTYSQAVKQMKFIEHHFYNTLPTVKLDLGTSFLAFSDFL